LQDVAQWTNAVGRPQDRQKTPNKHSEEMLQFNNNSYVWQQEHRQSQKSKRQQAAINGEVDQREHAG
jgi:hypothetical protein